MSRVMTDSESEPTTNRRTSSGIRFLEQFLEHEAPRKLTGLLLGKLDAFNRISTTFGQERAESFCAEYVQHLRGVLPEGTPIFRLSDRRFAVVLALDSMSAIMDTAAGIAEDEQPQIRVDGDAFVVDVTIGVAVYPTHAENASSLFRRAELALRQAHENELSFEIYQTDATSQQAALWKFETELEKAVLAGAIEVYYQPKLAIRERRVCGVEALARWRHDSGRLVGAEEFVPLAERTGCIVAITWLVFDAVAAMTDTWAGLEQPFSVAINVSPQVLGHAEFFDRVAVLNESLADRGVELVLELTEDSLIDSDTVTMTTLRKLKSIGVGLSIDDFGKGHSALTYLKNLPADELKIDKHFIGSLASDEKDRHIVQAVISLARAFGMRVVAEGVDNDESLRVIDELGCECAQGFYFSRPMRGDLLYEWVSSYGGTVATRLLRHAELKRSA